MQGGKRVLCGAVRSAPASIRSHGERIGHDRRQQAPPRDRSRERSGGDPRARDNRPIRSAPGPNRGGGIDTTHNQTPWPSPSNGQIRRAGARVELLGARKEHHDEWHTRWFALVVARGAELPLAPRYPARSGVRVVPRRAGGVRAVARRLHRTRTGFELTIALRPSAGRGWREKLASRNATMWS